MGKVKVEWLFADITETVSAAEAIWTAIALVGVWLCVYLAVGRIRTLLDIRRDGINGRYRMLSILRLTRVSMLGVVFLGFVIVGAHAMTLPTNPAIDMSSPRESIPTFAIMLIELILFIKLAVEEILENVINNIQDMKDAAQSQSTPRLDR